MTERYSHLSPAHQTRAVKILDRPTEVSQKLSHWKKQEVRSLPNHLKKLVEVDGLEPTTPCLQIMTREFHNLLKINKLLKTQDFSSADFF